MAQASSTDFEAEPLSLSPNEIYISSPNTRRPFRREQSWSAPDAQYHRVDQDDQNAYQDDEYRHDIQPEGLGLTDITISDAAAAAEIKRVPVGSRQWTATLDSPGSAGFSQATTARNTSNLNIEAGEWPTPQSSRLSLKESPYQHFPSNSNLLSHGHHQEGCPTHGDLLKTHWSGFTLMILFLALYSTIFSAVFLAIALVKPRWGHRIGPQGALSYDTATLLSALFSKMVELSFATTYVVTLGQILTRRALAKSHFSRTNKGISIADVNMRLWIMQPGTLFTHFTGAKYAVTTFLGMSALVAAIAGVFYTTAAEALVSPKLKFGKNETLTMFGEVKASYANAPYLSKTCSTPITRDMDPDNYGTTCLQIDLAGNGFRNLDSWLATWQERSQSNEAAPLLSREPRPPPVAVLYENTTVNGQWIYPSQENITADSEKYGRLVQNVTLAMPHANIFHAARSSKNRLLQPHDLQGAGEYYVKAAVPVPGLNVLCAGATAEELAPLVSGGLDYWVPEWPFTTVLDKLFNWTQNPDTEGGWYAPWFVKLPNEYNTVVNNSKTWGPDFVYVLGRKPPDATTSEYVLCGLRSFTYSDCSTSYHVAQSGGQLSVHCESDHEKWKPYWETRKSNELEYPMVIPSKDWKDVGSEWVRAVALTQGNVDSNASISRLMTQLMPNWDNKSSTKLDPIQPSIAEALGVLASYTLLLSSDGSEFVHFWDYARNALEEPAPANFSAILSYKDYASGGDQRWKGIFYLILLVTFLQNCFCLSYLILYYVRDGELTDFTEPQNLFALAMNSPPSQILAGACGGGPTGEALGRKWCVNMDLTRPKNDDNSHNSDRDMTHPHFYIRYPDEDIYAFTSSATASPNLTRSPGKSPGSKHVSWTPLLDMKRRRKSMPRPKSMQDLSGFGADESPAVAQYRRLIR